MTATPVRIQRKRIKGYKMSGPNNLPVVYVGRGSIWGNPFIVGKHGTPKQCVSLYIDNLLPYKHQGSTLEQFFISDAMFAKITLELKGKNLACWCPIECTICNGTGNKYTATLEKLYPITPPLIQTDCPQCNGTGRQPCHADVLLKIANEK